MLTEATIFRGAFWSAIGAIFERAMFFILPIFIAPLGPTSLGIFYISLRVFHSIVSFSAGALNAKYTHELRQYLEYPQSLRFERKAALLLKVYFFLGLFFGIFFLILILLTQLEFLIFLALALPFAIINSYALHVLRLLQEFKKIFLIQAVFIFGFQLLCLIIFIKFLHLGIMAAFASQLLMNILISFAAIFFLFDKINLLGLFDKINIKMFKLSFTAFTNVLFTTIYPIIDIVLVGLLFGVTTLGRYIILLYLPLLIHKIPTTLFNMFLHVAAVKTHKNEDITQVSMRVFKWILIITMPISVIIFVYPSPILSYLFHNDYVKDFSIIRLLTISSFLQSFSWIAGRILLAKKENFLYTTTNYVFLFLFSSLALLFASPFGLYGIALALLVSTLVDVCIKHILVVNKSKVLFIDNNHVKIILMGMFSSLFAYTLFSNNPMLFFSFFLFIYFSMLLIMGIVNKKAILDFKKMVTQEIGIGESEYD